MFLKNKTKLAHFPQNKFVLYFYVLSTVEPSTPLLNTLCLKLKINKTSVFQIEKYS